MLVIIKFLSLIFGLMFTIINFGSMKYGHEIPTGNLLVQSFCIALFIFLQFNLF